MNSPIGFILGSGWGGIIKNLQEKKETPYKNIFGHSTTVVGHSGKTITGKIFGRSVILLSGRFHTYEGYSSSDVTKTVRYLHEQGVKKIIITSAAGALNPKYKVGDLVILHDMITLFCQSPLSGNQFQNLSEAFGQDLINSAQQAAIQANLCFQKGVYVYLKGPHFETFADKMALRFLGADVVGMSTVPEVIMANHLGMQILGLSLVTNLAFVKHDHKEVLQAVKNQEQNLKRFFINLLKNV
ncbi:purine-nucleoside phosphorylase [Candidatus Gottesmanbacteria bacterium]|nr:purine-nucleoside phosphorylase [Candidatus Gottesmanbacteria bacterium]